MLHVCGLLVNWWYFRRLPLDKFAHPSNGGFASIKPASSRFHRINRRAWQTNRMSDLDREKKRLFVYSHVIRTAFNVFRSSVPRLSIHSK